MKQPIQTSEYDDKINEVALRDELSRQEYHTPSGRISASMMGKPVLWCVLKLIGIGNKDYDAFTLRKFARGNQAEDWFVNALARSEPFRYATQMKVSYRDGVGYVDLAEKLDYVRPHEIKSVTNMKYKRLVKGFVRKGIAATGPDIHHILQAAYYGLALNSPDFVIHYVASDDLRVTSYELETAEYRARIDSHIDRIEACLQSGVLPEFEPIADWQNVKTYWDFPEFYGLTAREIESTLQEKYPEAYERLKIWGIGE